MMLSDWLADAPVAARLTAAGLRPNAAQLAARCFVRSAAEINARGLAANAPVFASWVPGRIEVLGKHTDYCGGQSLLAAAERGFSILAAPRNDRRVQVIDAARPERCEFPLDSELNPRPGHWSNYPQTVARRLARNFPSSSHGATIAFASNLPASSGMSSSSALIVGTFLVLAHFNGLNTNDTYARSICNREDFAGYLSTVENGMRFGPLEGDTGVGTFGGSEDHTAILNCQPDKLSLYSFCPVRFQRAISVAEPYEFAIASSGVAAEKTGGALASYNRISALAAEIVRQWRRAANRSETSLHDILDSAPDAEERLRAILNASAHIAFTAQELTQRLDHFNVESRFINLVPSSIDAGTINAFGKLASESHSAADKLLRNQTRETNRLVELAASLGAYGATAFGAGFGGSVWAIIDATAGGEFLADWQKQYTREFPGAGHRAAFFVMRPGPPAFTWPPQT